MSLPKRFTDKIKQLESGCWEWQASFGLVEGYGRYTYNGRVGYAHRFAYEHCVGDIPHGFVVDHLCRNRKCVNPNHLRACTQRENTKARYMPPPASTDNDGVTLAVDQLSMFGEVAA